MDEQRILEMIDACRPGSNDVEGPALAELARCVQEDPRVALLYRRVQRLDSMIGAAIRDVPVPHGLEAAIVRRLEAARRPDGPAELPATVAPARQRVDALWIGVATAATVLIAVTSALIWSRRDPVTVDNIWTVAEGWCQQVDRDRWRPMGSAPAYYPPSRRVLANRFGWQPIRSGLAGGGVAYNLSGEADPPAMLLVARTTVAGLPGRPPRQPLWTQNRSIAAWQDGPLLFVLVVDGPPDRYRRLVDSRPAPLA